MTQTWRNEWRLWQRWRTAFRWVMWVGMMGLACNVLATVVQRVMQ